MPDANIGGGDFTRPAMQCTGGQHFRVIDGEPRRPSNHQPSIDDRESSASASAVGHFIRSIAKQTKQHMRKVKHKIRLINQYELNRTAKP
jgi:hypothetical protein